MRDRATKVKRALMGPALIFQRGSISCSFVVLNYLASLMRFVFGELSFRISRVAGVILFTVLAVRLSSLCMCLD